MKSRDYNTLTARMREKPTFATAEEVLKKDYPLKLPDRRWIQLWNTPEISQFRGIQDEIDATEANREQHEREQAEIRQVARETGVHTPDMDMVHELLTHQRQQGAAMQEHMQGLAELNRQHMEGLRAEQRAELERLANAQNLAANRAAMAEQALMGLRDVALEHRNMIGQLAAQTGHVQQNIDNSAITNIVHNHHHDENVHRHVMNLMQSHAAQFGEYARQQQLSTEQMQRLLYEHLSRNPPQPVIHIMRPPDEGMQVVQFSGSGPPPGPPGGGKVKATIKKQPKKPKKEEAVGGPPAPPAPPPPPPAPAPEPVPTIPATVPHYDIGTPPPPRQRRPTRSPSVGRATRARSRAPWRGGAEDPPAMPQPEPVIAAARAKRTTAEESSAAPVAARPKAKARARSVSVASEAETVFYPENSAPLQPAPKRRGRPPKAVPPAILPTHEAAMQQEEQEVQEVRRRGKEMAMQARVVANHAKFARPKATAKARARVAKGLPPVPEAAVPDSKPRVRKVAITKNTSADATLVKRGRGRPKGSLGKKKRDALFEAELKKLESAVV